MTPEEIKTLGHAFFDGKTLQYRYENGYWMDWTCSYCPGFSERLKWRIKPDDEVAREEIFALVRVLGVGVDEDVGKWRCGVTDIGVACGKTQKLPDQAVDRSWCFRVLRSVDGSVVRLIVNDKHGECQPTLGRTCSPDPVNDVVEDGVRRDPIFMQELFQVAYHRVPSHDDEISHVRTILLS